MQYLVAQTVISVTFFTLLNIMTGLKRTYFSILMLAICSFFAQAQDSAIGYWESHLPYNSALGVATDGNTMFTIGKEAFYTFKPNTANAAPVPYSKVDGMSDIGMQCIGYDAATSTVVLVYANGNIDLFKDHTFYNIPDLKVKTISGTKEVFQVYTENGFAYLSTSLGVLVIDLADRTFKQTYQFIDQATQNNEIIPVKSFVGKGGQFFAATPRGLFRADKNSMQLQNFQVWKKIDSTHTLTNMSVINNTLFFSTLDAVYTLSADTLQLVYTSPSVIRHIDAGATNLFISEYNDTTFNGHIRIMNQGGQVIDSVFMIGKPLQVVQHLDGSLWIADYFAGLKWWTNAKRLEGPYIPAGPVDASSFDIYAHNKGVWIAHGGYTPSYAAVNNYSGIASLQNGRWDGFRKYPIDNIRDFVVILRNERNNTLYAGSYLGGLFTLNANNTYSIIKDNSIFDSSTSYFGNGERQIVGLGLDKQENLWVTTVGSRHILYAKSAADSTWYKFTAPNSGNGGPMVVDDNNQVWFVCAQFGASNGGITVYDAAGTLADISDDYSYHFSTGAGAGNLPSNTVSCLVKDKNNNIWVGTTNGIAIISNCTAPFSQSSRCDAEIPIVQYDKYAGYLFEGSSIRTIAVDGANRKWVGTDDGVWLLSSDASKIIYRFTAENSPLPSNHIQKIAVDGITGDVYIGTEMGLISYRSTATDGGAENTNVLVYPNPVNSGYQGTIAIKGLVANADVRITDVKGQLVYQTKALGGQAVWNGLDYSGRRPQSGVYLIFASNTDGTAAYSGKIVFVQ